MLLIYRPEAPLPEINPVYNEDSSDEEDLNFTGDIPLEWYDDLPHVGYDLDGKPIPRKDLSKKDQLDHFLSQVDDPNSWRTVYDEKSGREIVLTDEDLKLLRKIESGEFVYPEAEDGYNDFTAYALNLGDVDSLVGVRPEPKRRFIPSKFEQRRVIRIARAISAGRIVLNKPKVEIPIVDLWASSDVQSSFRTDQIPAPIIELPDNRYSYNPPSEYLLSEEERAEIIKQVAQRNNKPYFDEPKKYPNLLSVPGYKYYIKDVYDRCVDLVARPRAIPKKREILNLERLLPDIPDPSTLLPFPTSLAFVYAAHRYPILSLSVDPSGKYLAVGSQDGYVFLFDVFTSRCLQRWYLGTETTKSSSATGVDANPEIDLKTKAKVLDYASMSSKAVRCLAWNPHNNVCMLAASIHNSVVMLLPSNILESVRKNTLDLIALTFAVNESENNPAKWVKPSEEEISTGHLLHLILPRSVSHISWHSKGNYFSTTLLGASSNTVMIHQLSKRISQTSFRKSKGIIQKVLFHPVNVMLIVVTQKSVRIYNIIEKKIEKRLIPGNNYISSVDIHPSGDHIIVGSYDKVVSWFDLDMGNTPYKKLRHHTSPVRCVTYHKSYPLFASCDSGGRIYLLHCSIYSDLTKDPLIVPLKKISHSLEVSSDVLCCEFHPHQPWIFSGGSDGKVCLYTDIHT